MAEKSTYIKVDRNIIKWRWYKNPNTLRVFLHLLIKANIEDHDFEGIVIRRGEVATSYASIAQDLDMSIKAVRVAVDHLKRTGEVASNQYSKFQVISILCYDKYQAQGAGKTAVKRQPNGRQGAVKGQQSKNAKEVKRSSSSFATTTTTPSRDDVMAYAESIHSKVNVDKFMSSMQARGWKYNGQPIEDWTAVFDMWNANERNNQQEEGETDCFGKPIPDRWQ